MKKVFSNQAEAKTVTNAPKKTAVKNQLNQITPEDLGISSFALCAFNSLKKDTPLVIKLAIAGDSKLTEYMMHQLINPRRNITGVANTLIREAFKACHDIAYVLGDTSTQNKTKRLSEDLELFLFEDDVKTLANIDNEVLELAKNHNYGALMNVTHTALHVGYIF